MARWKVASQSQSNTRCMSASRLPTHACAHPRSTAQRVRVGPESRHVAAELSPLREYGARSVRDAEHVCWQRGVQAGARRRRSAGERLQNTCRCGRSRCAPRAAAAVAGSSAHRRSPQCWPEGSGVRSSRHRDRAWHPSRQSRRKRRARRTGARRGSLERTKPASKEPAPSWSHQIVRSSAPDTKRTQHRLGLRLDEQREEVRRVGMRMSAAGEIAAGTEYSQSNRGASPTLATCARLPRARPRFGRGAQSAKIPERGEAREHPAHGRRRIARGVAPARAGHPLERGEQIRILGLERQDDAHIQRFSRMPAPGRRRAPRCRAWRRRDPHDAAAPGGGVRNPSAHWRGRTGPRGDSVRSIGAA